MNDALKTGPTIDVLLVENDPGDARLIGELLHEAEDEFELRTTGTLRNALAVLDEHSVDVLLLDLHLPDRQGLPILDRVVSSHPEVAVVVLTDLDDAAQAAQAVRAGAQDYLIKGRLSFELLTKSLRYAAESKRHELDLLRSRQRLEAVFHRATDAILLADDEGRFLEANPAACRLTGYDREELLEMSVHDLAAPELEAAGPELYRSFIQSAREEGKFTLTHKDGSTVHVEYRAVAAIQPGVHLSILTDVTERMDAERALRESEERYRRFFEEDLTGDCIATPAGRILECNPAFARIFGFASQEEARSSRLADLFPSPDDRREFLEVMKLRGRLERHEAEGRRISGEPVYLIANVVGDFDAAGELVAFRAYLFDDTERRKTEEQLLRAQKMEAVGRLAGGVAHDFNNLITAMTGYADLSLVTLPEESPAREYLEEIKQAGQRAADLARQLLAFSRRQVLKPEVLDLNGVVEQTERLLRRLIAENIHLTTRLTPGLPPVEADPGQLEQVLVNLAVNARDAMPHGGELSIATALTELTDADSERFGFPVSSGDYVVLSMEDTGCGMPPEVQKHIYEPFFTTKEPGQGTGLGLSTAYGIVKQTGGYILVESAPGRGTRFDVYVPRANGSPADEVLARAASSPDDTHGTETVLVVEDESSLRRLLVQVLGRFGYRVLEAANGREALRLSRRLSEPVHLVITDVVMPDMGGPDLAARLAESCPEVAVLFISGYPGETVVTRGDLAGDRPFLQKPFSHETLAVTVRKLLDRGTGVGAVGDHAP